MYQKLVLVSVALSLSALSCSGLSTRCFVCNSRGELGDCKDPFVHNATSFKDLPGHPVGVASCPSGWCRKQMDLIKGKSGDHGVSILRHCLQVPPPDGEERCAKVTIGNKPTHLCFCRGDLCNSALPLHSSPAFLQSAFFFVVVSLSALLTHPEIHAFLPFYS